MAANLDVSGGKFRRSACTILSSVVLPGLILLAALMALALPATVSAGDNNRLSVLLLFDASGIHLQRVYSSVSSRVGQNVTVEGNGVGTVAANNSLYLNKQVVKHFSASSAALMQQRLAKSIRANSITAKSQSANAFAGRMPMSYWFSADGDLLLTETIDDPRVVRVPGFSLQPTLQPGANITSISREEGVFLLRGPLLAVTLRVYLPDLSTSQGTLPYIDSRFDISVGP